MKSKKKKKRKGNKMSRIVGSSIDNKKINIVVV